MYPYVCCMYNTKCSIVGDSTVQVQACSTAGDNIHTLLWGNRISMKGEPKNMSVRWRMLCSSGGIFFGLRVESTEYLFVLAMSLVVRETGVLLFETLMLAQRLEV